MADYSTYPVQGNVPHCKVVAFKITLDGANAPTLAASPDNLFIASVARQSQGIFRLTLTHAYKTHVATIPNHNVNATGQARFAQGGPVANVGTSTPATVDILIVDGSGNVQDPAAANGNNFLSGVIIFADTAAV